MNRCEFDKKMAELNENYSARKSELLRVKAMHDENRIKLVQELHAIEGKIAEEKSFSISLTNVLANEKALFVKKRKELRAEFEANQEKPTEQP